VNVDQTHYTGNTNLGSFPLYHKAEGTMHDATLVPDWSNMFAHNLHKLAIKVSQHHDPHIIQTTPSVTHTDVANKYEWLQHVNKDSAALYNEVIQDNTYQVSHEQLRNMSVIDVGANMGMFSILAAGLGAPQVISCEPVGSTYHVLCDNVQRAHMSSMVQTIKAAVTGIANGPVSMGVSSESQMNSVYKPGEYSELVPTVSLQQLVQMTTQPQVFLKMDCEGAEYDILMDSEPHVFDKITHVAVEIHGDMHPTHKGLELAQNRLRDLGFTCTDAQPFGMWWYDHTGTPVRFDPLNITIETWKK
jgi:FkbM family methyltransferase